MVVADAGAGSESERGAHSRSHSAQGLTGWLCWWWTSETVDSLPTQSIEAMDFVNNIWSKTGLKSKDQAADEGETPAQEKTEEPTEPTEGAKDGAASSSTSSTTVGFVSNLIKSTFKSNDGESGDRKASVTSDQAPEETATSSPKGFVSNIFKNPFKSAGDKDGERKDSTSSTTESNKGEAEKGEGEGSIEGASTSEAVGQKALDSAKHFGSFLSSVANKAGATISATAKQLKHTVESNSLLADFTKEQQEFLKEHGGDIEAADPPWLGCENEELVKSEIISLSQDKRNFVRNPPAGVEFDFNLPSSLPVALAILKEDPNLAKMRYEIVPKLVNEETFWRNYFYRVSLLKQSTQANSLKGCKSGYGSSSSSEAEGPDEISPTSEQVDAFQDESQVDVDSTMKQMGITRNDTQADEKNWEDEITKDLQEFEVVGVPEVADEDLEKDLAAL